MSRAIATVVCLLSALAANWTFAAECDSTFQNANHLYKCALSKDPRIRSLAAKEKERAGRISEAKQLPNPVGEFEGTDREISGSIVQPIEIGGKRSARENLGEIENQASLIEDQLELGEVALEIAQALNRFHQLATKMELLEATKRSLANLTSRLRAKAVRTPEERVAVGLFGMQSTLIETRLISVQREQAETRAVLESSIGRKLTSTDQLRFPEKRTWPNLSELKNSESIRLRLKEIAVRRLEGALKVQQSLAWPDLAIGPYFNQDRVAGESSFGAKIEFGLPLWNRNRGAKLRAEGEFERLKVASEQTLMQERLAFEALSESYNTLVRFLNQSASSKSLQQSLKETLDLFSRGMIQPSNVIETYRTAFETLEAVQDAEASAVLQYWTIQIAKGSVPKEIP